MPDPAHPAPIETHRLRLVPLTVTAAKQIVAGDLTPLDGLSAAPGWPHADTLDALAAFAAHATDGDVGPWLIVRAETGEILGECGWKSGPAESGEVEIGYGLAASVRRRGYGVEAVAGLLSWVERQPGVRAVLAEVEVGNVASRRLLERLGFVVERVQGPFAYYRRAPADATNAAT
jgi:ribosomal-protein-alanine N-acetyltransferase